MLLNFSELSLINHPALVSLPAYFTPPSPSIILIICHNTLPMYPSVQMHHCIIYPGYPQKAQEP